LWATLIIASIPAGLAGVLLRHWVKDTLFNPTVVAISLIIGGIAFIIIERRPQQVVTTSRDALTWRQAILVGVAQMLAIIPGVSRSGATIMGALLVGVSREAATAFS